MPDDDGRYRTPIAWSSNSCAVDVVLWLAIQMDAGRLQVDMECPTQYHLMNPAARALRVILATSAWAQMSSAAHTQHRDLIRHILAVYDPTKFPPGQNLDIADVVTTLFDRLPQASFTQLACYQCCNTSFWVVDANAARRVCVVDAIGGDFSHGVARNLIQSFDDKAPSSTVVTCTANPPTGIHNTRLKHFVLDRLPYTFIYNLGSFKLDPTLFRNFTIDPPSNETHGPVEYQAVGAIFFSPQVHHFYARWWGGSVSSPHILHFDSLPPKGQSIVTDIEGTDILKNIRKSHRISHVFYRRLRMTNLPRNKVKKVHS